MPYINWDEDRVRALYKEYKKHKAKKRAGDDPFTFKGNKYIMSYTKYLLEYLSGKFPNVKIKIKEL